MARVAICISGLTRTFSAAVDSIKEYFDGVEAEFFLGAWSDPVEMDNVLSIGQNKLAPRRIRFASQPNFDEIERKIIREFLGTRPDFSILSQWWGVRDVIELPMEQATITGRKYDWVVRCRYDLRMKGKFIEVLPESRKDSINITNDGKNGSDQFVYGSPEVMQKFRDFPEWLFSYPETYGREYGFYASPLMRLFFLSNGTPVNRANFRFTVTRGKAVVENGIKISPRQLRERRNREYISRKFPEFSENVWLEDAKQELAGYSPRNWTRDYRHMLYSGGIPERGAIIGMGSAEGKV